MNLENVSAIKKLLILRESIDMALQGIRPDMNVIDACYEDLVKDMADYEMMMDEVVGENNLDTVSSGQTQNNAKKQFGESYLELIQELQKLNERVKKNYICYIVEDIKDPKKLNLRIWDDHEGCWVRTYTDKADLDANLYEDMRYEFSKPKKKPDFEWNSKVNPLPENYTTEDYLRAEFGDKAAEEYRKNHKKNK